MVSIGQRRKYGELSINFNFRTICTVVMVWRSIVPLRGYIAEIVPEIGLPSSTMTPEYCVDLQKQRNTADTYHS